MSKTNQLLATLKYSDSNGKPKVQHFGPEEVRSLPQVLKGLSIAEEIVTVILNPKSANEQKFVMGQGDNECAIAIGAVMTTFTGVVYDDFSSNLAAARLDDLNLTGMDRLRSVRKTKNI